MKSHPLKMEREQRGWSQARLAELLGVTTRTVARWEEGQTFPYPHYREQLCALFGKTASALGLVPENDLPLLISTQEQTEIARTQMEASFPTLYDPMVPEALGSPPRLVGREDLLMQLSRRLQVGKDAGMMALSGLPGVGKTALAAALARDRQVQASFPDGILWAGIGPQPGVLSLLGRWGALLGAVPPTGKAASQVEEWRQTLRTVIGKRRMLLVLDDAWTVETALVMQVGGPNCAYLLTTRSPQVAFAFAEKAALSVPELAEDEGIALLERAVPRLVAQEPEQIRALVRAVGGLPLALKLLAQVLAAQVFTGQPRRVQATLARLQEAEQRLRISLPTALEERPLSLAWETPLSLQATIAISEQHLSEPARHLLRALAVFPAKPNSFSEEAALAVGQMPLETLDEIWDAGLLESQGPGRYQLHQTIVDHARVQGIALESRERLVRFTTHYLREHAQDHEALERELNNILAALEMAEEVGLPRKLIEIMDLLILFLEKQGRYLLARQYLQRASEAALALGDTSDQMRMLQHLAFFEVSLGEYQQAERDGLHGLELARQLDEREVQCALLRTLGLVSFRQGDYHRTIASCEEGLELARQIGAVKHICSLLSQLSAIAGSQGHYDQAQATAQEGLALARQLEDAPTTIDLIGNMANVATKRGEQAQAESFLHEALTLADQVGHHEWQVRLLNRLAILMQLRGDHKQATSFALRGMELARQIGHRFFLCGSLENVGIAMIIGGRYAEAEEYLLESLELARELNYIGLPGILSCLGELVGGQGDYARANAYFEESVQLARQMNSSGYLGAALANWGDVHLHCQHPDAAALAYQEVLTLADTIDLEPWVTAQARYGLARVASQRGELAQARQLGQQSLADFEAASYYKATEVREWLRHLDEQEGDRAKHTGS